MTVIIVPPTPSSSSKSHTGAIAGGVAGGIIALAAAVILLLFCWRRNRRQEQGIEGNFDPGRIVRPADDGQPNLAGGAEITPYHYDPPSSVVSGPISPTFSDGSMRQYRDSQGLMSSTYGGVGGVTATSSGSQYAPTSSDGPSPPPGSSSQARSNSYSSAVAPAPGFPVAQPYYRPLSSKEQEVLRKRAESGLGLASQPEEGEGNIMQHSDGGRITEPVPPDRPTQEVPPSYYSIHGDPY